MELRNCDDTDPMPVFLRGGLLVTTLSNSDVWLYRILMHSQCCQHNCLHVEVHTGFSSVLQSFQMFLAMKAIESH